MRKLLIGGIAATLLATSVAGVAIAHEKGEKGEYRQSRLAEELNLSEEQQARMQKLWSEHKEERRQMREDMRDGPMSGLRDLDPNSESFQADVDKLIADAQARAAERIRDHARMKQEMNEILTPEQQARMQELMAERGEQGIGSHKGEHRGEGRDCH